MGLIFDLDQTLIDSSIAENNRNNRNWSAVYPQISSFTVYDGIHEALEYAETQQIPMVIVTSSPSVYCNRVLEPHFKSKFIHTVCYHDTARRKPFPDPIQKAMGYLDNSKPILSFGDRDIDITASNEAGVISIACNWGAADRESLLAANPKHIINNPLEIIEIIKMHYQ